MKSSLAAHFLRFRSMQEVSLQDTSSKSKACSGRCQTSKMKLFYEKNFIVDVRVGPKNAFYNLANLHVV